MSLVRNAYAVSTRRGFLGALFSALLALALFFPGAATSQELKRSGSPRSKFRASWPPPGTWRRRESKRTGSEGGEQAEAVAKKNGFASLAEYDDVATNISMIMSGLDPQTKRFTEPPEQIKKEIARLKADKTVAEAEKKRVMVQLEAALKSAKPIQFKENIALVLKYFDKLSPLMQG